MSAAKREHERRRDKDPDRYRRKRSTITSPWIGHTIDMRQSIAWQFLPDNARRVLDRIELEHMRHGGAENGRLPCTYDDFKRAGVRRESVAIAIRQCVALGFLEVTRRGGRSRAETRWPSLYRLTYVSGRGSSPVPTNDWQRIKTEAEALDALRLSGNPNSNRRVRKCTSLRSGENAPTKSPLLGAKTPLQA